MTALYPAPSVADQFRPPSLHDAFVGQSVGPQPEDTAGAEHPSCASESCGLVEVRVARVQEIARRVVDVHQDRVVGVLVLPTKRNTCADRLEEVRGYKAASGVGRQLLAQRTRCRRCHSITSGSASITSSVRMRWSAKTALAVYPRPRPPTATSRPSPWMSAGCRALERSHRLLAAAVVVLPTAGDSRGVQPSRGGRLEQVRRRGSCFDGAALSNR